MKKITVVMGMILAMLVIMEFPCWGEGDKGDQGIQGLRGDKGDKGDKGDEDVIYYGCYQKNNGQLRIMNNPRECRSSEVAISWNEIGPPGLTWQGPWTGTTAYELDDAVSYNGSSYISLVGSNIGHQPDLFPTFWAMLAQKGDIGAQGVKGDKGDSIKGDPGATGAPGAAGHSPVLTWSGEQLDQIAIDGAVTGPHLTGPQGPAGPQGPQGEPGPVGPSFTFDKSKIYLKLCKNVPGCYCDNPTDVLISGGVSCSIGQFLEYSAPAANNEPYNWPNGWYAYCGDRAGTNFISPGGIVIFCFK